MKKNIFNLPSILKASFLMIILLSCTFSFGQTVLNNGYLRLGNGNENSVNTYGNVQQPFYFNSTYNTWYKLTYWNYPLDYAIGVGGDGSSEWNTSGTISTNPALAGQVINTNGYVSTGSLQGYGQVISTGTVNIGGQTFLIEQTYQMPQASGYVGIRVRVTNTSGTTAQNVRIWVGTRDDWVGNSDQPTKQKGNLVNGAFSQISSVSQQSQAIKISSGTESVLVFTNSDRGYTITQQCCGFSNVIYQNPLTIGSGYYTNLNGPSWTGDGSYGFYVRMNDLSPNETDEFTWYYAAGAIGDIDDIIDEVAQAAGSVQNISCTSVDYNASSSQSGTGYYVVVPDNASAPTAAQIKSGVNYSGGNVVNSGNATITANQQHTYQITGLSPASNYKVFFVVEDASQQFSSIVETSFSTVTSVPTISCAGNVTANSASGLCGAYVNFTAATASGNCGTPAITYSHQSGDFFPSGTTTVTATATDIYGNTASCTFDITVNDVEKPNISCPFDIISDTDPGQCGAVITYNTPSATDNCGTGALPTSITGYSYEGTLNGHTYFLSDNKATPEAAHAAAIALGGHLVTITSYQENVFVSNFINDRIWIGYSDREVEGTWKWITSEPVSYTNWAAGEPNNAGNEDWAVINWSGTNPDWNDWTFTSTAYYAVEFDGGTIPTTLVSGPASGDFVAPGVHTVTYQATDPSGNTEQCSFTVTVNDNENPVVNTQNITVQLGLNGNVSISPADIDNGSTDACGIANMSLNKYNFNCSDIGPNTVTLTVVDNNGNINTGTVIVTVDPTPAPVAGNDVINAEACSSITFTDAQLLGNDSDPENQTLKVDAVTNNGTGTLVDNGNGTYTYTPASNTNHTVNLSYTIKRDDGTTVYSVNGHFYEFVSSSGITWTNAKTAAEQMTYLGMQGYLATITSAGENTFASSKLQGQGWIGASDEDLEGEWKWKTGPEAGQQFWQGAGNGSAYNGMYNKWNGGEPNDAHGGGYYINGEDYAHFLSNGKWNDYPVNNGSAIVGYVVEYGGMPGDCQINATATAALTINFTDNIPPNVVTQDITVQLDANGQAVIAPSDIDNGSSDGCGIASLSLDKTNFDCSDVGTQQAAQYAIKLDGQNDYIDMGNFAGTLVNASQATAQVWLSPWAVGGGVQSLFEANVNGYDYFSIETNGASKVDFYVTGSAIRTNVDVLQVGEWINLTAVYDGTLANTSQRLKIYINGQLANTTLFFGTPPAQAGNLPDFYLGSQGGTSQFAKVTYDEVRVWDYALTPQEVASNWNQTLVGNENGLIAYYSFEDGPGSSTVTELTGIQGSAQLTNMDPNTVWVAGADSLTQGASGVEVTLTATDVNGNPASSTALVTVEDNLSPVMNTNSLTFNLANRTSNPLTQADIDQLGANSSDNCAVTFDIVSGPINYDCSNIGQTFNLILRGTDPSGNTATTPVTVTVADPGSVCNDPPVAACQNITLYTDASCSASIVTMDIDGGSSDPDGDVLTYTVDNTGPFGVGTHTVTLTVSDGEYSDNCTAVITVLDTMVPNAVCQNVTVYLDAQGSGSILNAGGTSTMFFEDWTADASGYYNNQATTNWNVTSDIDLSEFVSGIAGKEIDLAGWSNSSIETIQTFTFAPGDYTLSFQHITNAYSNNSVQLIIGSLVNQTFNSSNSIQTATANFTVTSATTATIKMVQLGTNDAGGSFIGQIKLQEHTAPSLAIENGSTDACGIASITASKTTFDCSDVGNNTVILTVTDVNGNTSNCSATVTVIDSISPVISCNANMNVDSDPQLCGAVINYPDPIVSDNCLGTTNSSGLNSGQNVLLIWDVINTHTTSLQNALTAAGMNVTLSSTSETAYNGTNPSLTNFDAVIHLNGTTYTQAMPTSGQTALVDFVTNQGGVYITDEWSAYEVLYGGMSAMSEIVVLQRSSGLGGSMTYNTVSSQSSHPILSGIPSSFILPYGGSNTGSARNYSANPSIVLMTFNHGDAVVVRDFPNGGAAIGFAHAGNYSNSTILSDVNVQQLYINSSQYNGVVNAVYTQTSGLPSGSVFPIGTTTNTFTVTDPSGNTASCSFDITVTDNTLPAVITQNISVQLDANGQVTITEADIDNGSNDACGIASLSLDNYNFSCSDVGANTVTLTVTDNNSNVSTQTATVTVEDNVDPVALTQNITVQLDANGQASITTADIDNGSNDACGIASLSLDNYNFNCDDTGANTVILTVTDNNGNTSTGSATVTVEDNINPVISGTPSNISVIAQPNDCTPSVSWTAPTASDNCTVSLTSSHNPGDNFAVGTTTVTYTATDASGNSVSTSFTVTVTPTPLVSTISAATYAGGYNISCNGFSDGSIDLSISGGCLPYTYSWSNGATSEDISSLTAGTYNVDITDANGTTISESITLTEPATLTVSGSSSGYLSGSGVTGTTLYIGYGPQSINLNATASGGVGPYSYSWSPAASLSGANTDSPVASPLQTTTYTVTATDQNGCTATFDVTVDVIDATCGNNNQNKVYVCHRTGNAKKGYSYHNICISVNAVQTHLNHGDYLGPCMTSSKMAEERDDLDELHYHIYPNPTTGITNIELEMDTESDINIMIFDMTGKLLQHISETAVEGHTGYQVDMSTYAKGVYLVKIQSGEKVQTERLIKE